MNKQSPNSGIDYADYSWNPIVGCSKACPVRADCWARKMAKRVGKIIDCPDCEDFNPHLHPERLDEPLRLRKPSVIAVSFMGDFFDPMLKNDVRERVLSKCILAERHTFLFLTKEYEMLASWHIKAKNIYYGVSVSAPLSGRDIALIQKAQPDWFSFEPFFHNLRFTIERLVRNGIEIKQGVIGFLTINGRSYSFDFNIIREDLLATLGALEVVGSTIWLKANVINTAGFRQFNKPKWRQLIWRAG